MDNFDDIADPLDLAFAHPKAGKKLKAGESLPGLDSQSQHYESFDTMPIVPDAGLSNALDDAFSNPNFGAETAPPPAPEPAYVEDCAVIQAKLARDLDDAFSNPKVGKKIEDGTNLSADLGFGTSGLHDLGLESPRTDDLSFGQTPTKSGGLFGPKFLVVAMVLIAVGITVVMGGVETTTSTPTILRLD